jgi:hypothetical protein
MLDLGMELPTQSASRTKVLCLAMSKEAIAKEALKAHIVVSQALSNGS